MDEAERERLLRRIDRSSATVGSRVPDTIDIGGETIDLSSFLVEIRNVDRIPPAERERVSAARRTLVAERERLRGRLETDSDLTLEKAEDIAARIIGIDRAIHALATIRSASFGEATRDRSLSDQKQWVRFLNKLTD